MNIVIRIVGVVIHRYLYYANESWLIRTTALKEQFLQNNDGVTWYPDHMKHGRFGNFLEKWWIGILVGIRYWGTPLNVWQCERMRS